MLILFPLLIFYNSKNTFSMMASISIVLMLTAFSTVRMEAVLFALLLLWALHIFAQKDKTITLSTLLSCVMMFASSRLFIHMQMKSLCIFIFIINLDWACNYLLADCQN